MRVSVVQPLANVTSSDATDNFCKLPFSHTFKTTDSWCVQQWSSENKTFYYKTFWHSFGCYFDTLTAVYATPNGGVQIWILLFLHHRTLIFLSQSGSVQETTIHQCWLCPKSWINGAFLYFTVISSPWSYHFFVLFLNVCTADQTLKYVK